LEQGWKEKSEEANRWLTTLEERLAKERRTYYCYDELPSFQAGRKVNIDAWNIAKNDVQRAENNWRDQIARCQALKLQKEEEKQERKKAQDKEDAERKKANGQPVRDKADFDEQFPKPA
jgi:hypothetical protein